MKIRIDSQIKLSLALLVLIGTRFTLAEITDNKTTDCDATLNAQLTQDSQLGSLYFTNTSSRGWQIKQLSLALANNTEHLLFDSDHLNTNPSVTLQAVNQKTGEPQSLTMLFSDFPSKSQIALLLEVDHTAESNSAPRIDTSLVGSKLQVEFLSPAGKLHQAQNTFSTGNSLNLTVCT